MEREPLFSIKLPERRDIDVYLVRLPDGRIVARTKEELEELEEEHVHKAEEKKKEREKGK